MISRLRIVGTPLFLLLIAFLALRFYVNFPRSWDGDLAGHTEKSGPTSQVYLGQILKPALIRAFLGLRVVTADLVWIDLAVKSDTLRETKDESNLYKALEVMLELDPLNFYGAWYGAVYLSVVKDDITGASKLFEIATERLKQNPWVPPRLRGAIYFAYGYHLLFEEHRFDKAAEMIRESADLPEALPLAKDLARSLSTEAGQLTVGFRVLNESLSRAKSAEEKGAIEVKMKRLLIRKELLDLEMNFQSYVERSTASHLPKKVLFKQFLRSINSLGKNLEGKRFAVSEETPAAGGVKIHLEDGN